MSPVSRAADLWRSLEPRAQITLAACAVAVFATVYVLFQLGSRPDWTVVASGLSTTEGAQVAQSLEGAGIAYELRDGGAVVAVERGKETSARVALAEDGLPNGGHVGYEIFDKKRLGATDFEQKVAYQRALEGEISRTIEDVDGVRAASVQLVLPKQSLFLDEGSKASAAVLIDGGSSVGSNAIGGIARLVSSSVEGLKPEDVTITDEAGVLLWPGDFASGGVDGASAQFAAERAYSNQLTAQLDALVISTLGPGKASVRVNADLDLDKRQIDSVTYGKTGVPLTAQKDVETLANGKQGAGNGGEAGVSSNVPGYSATGATGATGSTSSSGYLHDSGTTEYGVDKKVESVTVSPGSVKRLSVALVVDKGVPASDVAALQQSVSAAAGIDKQRGDVITVSKVAFAAPEASKPAAAGMLDGMGGPLGLAKKAMIGIGAILLFFMIRKGLKRRETEGVALEPTWLREVTEARSLAELEATMIEAPKPPDTTSVKTKQMGEQIEEIVRRQPEAIAAQVAQWMNE
ncbi:MAG: flagellar basal-body MS-ring/collar protein FliF [Gaiellales bacterium]